MDKWNHAKSKAAVWWTQTPASIKAAIFLVSAVWGAYAMFLASLQKTIPSPTWRQPIITSILIEAVLLAQLGFGLYIMALIGQKRALGRLAILVAFGGLSVLRFMHSVKLHADTGTAVFLMLGAASALLFTRESRVWFRSRRTRR
ncbi:hypothetical protein LFL96_09395 [Paraburkholderia sp. D15]|uniref:hypothetical protein n=1 Tax=Paraburkholderia sp. D15 TaxID=2880218 RepID=UPI0024796E3C|nr:hypothetical protein [Paraburkholderia sp. D15]WGS51688.1 hypothetical protein LFL96_09395 [Paraburkholderia sp. D15]